MQDKLYAEGKEGVVFVLQAMDAAGKDGTVNHVFSGVNPQGVRVISFKQPSKEELSHDFLWCVNNVLPERGMIADMKSFIKSVTVRLKTMKNICMKTAIVW